MNDATPAPGGPTPTGGTTEAVRAAFRRALRDVLILIAAVSVLGVGVGYLLSGLPGVWGALIASAVTVFFSGSTIVAMLLTARSSMTTALGAVVGTWLVKTLVLIVVVGALRGMDFYDSGVLGVVVIVGVLGSVLLDYRAVTATRVPYVEPRTEGGQPEGKAP